MSNNRQLGDGIELVKEDIFWPEGQWSIRKGEMVWSKTEGWKRYYEINRADSMFQTAEEALGAWEYGAHYDTACERGTDLTG